MLDKFKVRCLIILVCLFVTGGGCLQSSQRRGAAATRGTGEIPQRAHSNVTELLGPHCCIPTHKAVSSTCTPQKGAEIIESDGGVAFVDVRLMNSQAEVKLQPRTRNKAVQVWVITCSTGHCSSAPPRTPPLAQSCLLACMQPLVMTACLSPDLQSLKNLAQNLSNEHVPTSTSASHHTAGGICSPGRAQGG